MWLQLGDNEIINLNHVTSIKKGTGHTIEISFTDTRTQKVIPFQSDESRDKTYSSLIASMVRLGIALS